jgi:hypothetical protein
MKKEQAATLLASVLGKEVSATDISLEDVVAVGLVCKPLAPTETEGFLIFPTKPLKVVQFSGKLHTLKSSHSK